MIDWSSIELSDRFSIVFFSDQGERSHRLSVESFHRDDESRFFRVHLRKFNRSFIGLGTTTSEKCVFQISWSDLSKHTSKDAAEGIDELLGWHRVMEKL